MATAHVGNYGVHDEEVESNRVQIAGLVTKNFRAIASRVGGSGTLAGLHGPRWGCGDL
jgi:carbamoyl-phosphate synthase small subunit